MSSGEQFSLCWDSFHKNLASGMQALLETEDLVDVTLAVEGKYLKAHKMVLSLCSPYFKELFSMNPCKHPIVFMKDVSYLALSDLLTFMYQGEVQVNQEHLGTFIKTAEALQIKGLTGDTTSKEDEQQDDHTETQPQQKPKTQRQEEQTQPDRRPKKPLSTPGPSPAVKRQKLEPPKPQPKEESSPLPMAEEILQFKVEPYDGADQSNIENVGDNQLENYDETADDTHGADDNEDYSVIEGEDDAPQAGTSAEGVGDGQATTGAQLVPQRLIERHFLEYIPPTGKKAAPCRTCAVCRTKRDENGKRKRKETRYYCRHCNLGLCAVPCFMVYHTKLNF